MLLFKKVQEEQDLVLTNEHNTLGLQNTPHIVRITQKPSLSAVIAFELPAPIVQHRNRADVVLFGIDNAGIQYLVLLEFIDYPDASVNFLMSTIGQFNWQR